jgi:putative redox protein
MINPKKPLTKSIKAQVLWRHLEHPRRLDFVGETPHDVPAVEIGYPSQEHVKPQSTSPKELLLQAMASCSGMDVVSVLEKMREPLEDCSISVDGTQDEEATPKVFTECTLNYSVTGAGLNPAKAARAVFLSLTKYCGVSAMVRRAGVQIIARLQVNGIEVNLWDANEQSQKLNAWLAERASRPVALVFGASRGIGHALCIELVRQGYAVLPVTRHSTRFEDENIFESLYGDFTIEESLHALGDFLKSAQALCDLVVYSGAVLDPSSVEELSVKELRHSYETNVFGPLGAHKYLQSVLTKDAICAFISSIMGHKMRESHAHAAYRLSKGTLLQFARQLGLHATASGSAQTFLSLHPGSVATDMNPGGKLTVSLSSQKIGELLAPGQKSVLHENNGVFWSLEGTNDLQWVVR